MNAGPINMILTSQIYKRRLERITWKRFYIKQSNQFKQTSLNTQPAPFLWPSTNLRRNRIHMSSLDTCHRQFSITPEDKFQDQWILIQSMQANRSTINNAKMISKTPKRSNWIIINQINDNNLYRLNCSFNKSIIVKKKVKIRKG